MPEQGRRLGRWLAGLLVLGATTAVLPAMVSPADPSDAALIVPVSRVGDRIAFVDLERDEGTGEWTESHRSRFALTHLSEELGSDGLVHKALHVDIDARLGGIVRHSVAENNVQWTQAIDLETRRGLRAEVAAFGWLTKSFIGDAPTSLWDLRHQGHTYAPDQPLSPDPAWREAPGGWAIFGFSFTFRTLLWKLDAPIADGVWVNQTVFEQVDVASRVGQWGTVDGRPALPIVHDLQGTVNGWDVSGRVEARITEWLAPDVPYAIAVQYDVHGDDLEGGARLRVQGVRRLVSYEPGAGEALVWGQGSVEPERSPLAGRPADGAGSMLPYPMSTAILDAEHDLLLPEFQLWRLQHPQGSVVSASLAEARLSRSDLPILRWTLVFADEAGEAYVVAAERTPDGSWGQRKQVGPGRIPDFSADEMPDRPLTIAAAEKAWQGLAGPEYRGRAPNRIDWAPDVVRLFVSEEPGFPCPYPEAVPPSPDTEGSPFRLLAIGWQDGSRCTEASSEWRMSQLAVDVASGQALDASEIRRPRDAGLPLLSKEAHPVEVQTARAPFLLARAPAILGLGASSLLLVLIAAYFHPVLKFAFFAGYSKLRRESVLDQRVREQLHEAIQADPGVHTAELARRLGLGWGTAVHHLGVLQRHRLVSSQVDGRHRRFFPVGLVDHSRQSQLAALRHDTTRRAYDFVLARPELTTTQAAQDLGVTTAAALWHLRRLHECGLVESRKVGRTVHHRARPLELSVAKVAAA